MDGQIRLTIDRGWAWVVCAACFSLQFVVFGIIQSYGTIFIALIREFKSGESEAAWVGSLAYGLIFLSGPMTTALIEHYGCRKIACLGSLVCSLGLLTSSFAPSLSWMYLTFSVVWGLGASLSFFSSLLVLRFYFYHKLSLANGIAMTGSAIGTLLMNFALGKMNDSLGWRMSWRILSAIAAGSCVSGCAFLPPPNVNPVAKQLNQYEKVNLWQKLRRTMDVRPWKNKAFLMYLTALSFILFGYFVPYVHLVRLAETRGVPTYQGSLLVGYLSISQIFGKLLFGRLADHRWFNKVYLISFSGFMLSLTTACATLAQDYGGLLAFALAFGFFDGGLVVVVPMVTMLIVGREQMANAYGGMYAIISLPLTLGPPLSAVLYDYTGSYAVAFYTSSSLIAVGVSLMYVVERLRPPLVLRTQVLKARGEAVHSFLNDSATNIQEASAASADGMRFADITSLARERVTIESAQDDAESMSLSLIFPTNRIFCDPLSHTSYSLSTRCSDTTISLIVPDINVILSSDSESITSNMRSSIDMDSLPPSMGETSQTLRADYNDELLRVALENLARKEKETVQLNSTDEEHPVISDSTPLPKQQNEALAFSEQESTATLIRDNLRDRDNREIKIEKHPQIFTAEMQKNIGSESPAPVSTGPMDQQIDGDIELETVRLPPPPKTPQRNTTPLVDLGNPDITVNVEYTDHSRLTSTCQSIPESLLSIQESLRSRQDASVNDSMFFDRCMFSDSAQVSALSERLEAVAAHRRSLEEAELAALLANVEGTTINSNSEIFSEADEEILQVKIPPPPSSSKRRSCTSSVSYDSPIPSLVDQNQLSSTNLSRNESEVELIFGHDDRIGTVGPRKEEEKAEEVDLLNFITNAQGNKEEYLSLSNRQEHPATPSAIENLKQNETEMDCEGSPPLSSIAEPYKTWQQLKKINNSEASEGMPLHLPLDSGNNKNIVSENKDFSVLIHQEKTPLFDVYVIPETPNTKIVDIKNKSSEVQECSGVMSTADVHKNTLPEAVSETASISFLSEDGKKIIDSTPTKEIWQSNFVPSTAGQELPLIQNDDYMVPTVPLENSPEVNQKLSSSKVPEETQGTADQDSIVIIEVVEKPLIENVAADKERSPAWDLLNKELLSNQTFFAVQSTEPKNENEICQKVENNFSTVPSGANEPELLGSDKEPFLADGSTQKVENTSNRQDDQIVHLKSTLEPLENDQGKKLESDTRNQTALTSPFKPEMQTLFIIANVCEPPSAPVSNTEMTSDAAGPPATASATLETSEMSEPVCRTSQEIPAEVETCSSKRQPINSETTIGDKNASLAAYKEDKTNITPTLKQLKLNPKILIFNESEDDSSADEDINQEKRELAGIEPLIAGSEILPKEYFRDLERTRTRSARPLSGSSSGSQSGYSTDTSFSESDSESISIYYCKIPELSEPEDESK